ncbi:unnamed protein product [Brachionus calyciflorus]|uniref:Uncharacterized protein n=1 Tax=Brachionus calyciflorus TaxID=104777 RepID=A0A814LPK8_9BILA|nr:unnamed protein product [Brachionus calyciflorus]
MNYPTIKITAICLKKKFKRCVQPVPSVSNLKKEHQDDGNHEKNYQLKSINDGRGRGSGGVSGIDSLRGSGSGTRRGS